MIRIDKDQFLEQFNENLDQLPVEMGSVIVQIKDEHGTPMHIGQAVRWLEFESKEEMERYLNAVLGNAIIETDIQEV